MSRMLILTGFIFGMIGIIHAQAIQGNITDIRTNQPIEGVTVYLSPDNKFAATDLAGNFSFRSVQLVNCLLFTAIGYQSRTVSLKEFQNHGNSISLSPVSIELSAVTISPRAGESFQAISKIDLAIRDISNSQEVLRLVPGLFIGQHQGGGKRNRSFCAGLIVIMAPMSV